MKTMGRHQGIRIVSNEFTFEYVICFQPKASRGRRMRKGVAGRYHYLQLPMSPQIENLF